ncbi:hypothetical protein RHSIM_Rhsim03G0038100 [Rhododendron simsii]|uniref:Pectinesterase n=1 Tax=Rhododendron simsii TaxID=118357 RepID=A0A834HA96_RHOSS|nr:hypothetical protein RHSIM_Rhsim03G0038100 [Rhododendron simsii]
MLEVITFLEELEIIKHSLISRGYNMNLRAAPDNLGVTKAQPSFAIVPRRLFTSLHFHERTTVGWNMIATGNLKTVLPAISCHPPGLVIALYLQQIDRWHAELLAILLLMMLCTSAHSQIMDIDVTVAKDGSGNFSKVQEAINHAPNFSPRRYKIQIREGIYIENITVPEHKINLMLVGDGMDKTTISGNRSTAGGTTPTYQTATAAIEGQGFVACDITFQNTAGPQDDRAVALRVEANHSAFYRCRFKGYQDTLYTRRESQFFRDCEIYGTVDIIFGDSSAVFQNCIIYALKPLVLQKNTITAQKREYPKENSGIIIHNCTIMASPELRQQGSKFKTFLGRPWGNFSRTIILQSFLDNLIDPGGWLEWEGKGHSVDKVDYAEYENRGPGASTVGRVKWARVINSSGEATKFTVRNFIEGDTWIPSIGIPYFLDLM